jgi:hypothetical protein
MTFLAVMAAEAADPVIWRAWWFGVVILGLDA